MGAFLSTTQFPQPSARLSLSVPSTQSGASQLAGQLFKAAQGVAQAEEQILRLKELQDRKKQALEKSVANKRLAALTEEISRMRYDLEIDPETEPLQKREILVNRFNQIINNIGSGLRETEANDLIARAQVHLTEHANSLDASSITQHVKRWNEDIDAHSNTYMHEFAQAQTQMQRDLALSNYGKVLNDAQESGIITEAQKKERLSDFAVSTNEFMVRSAINANPQEMFKHLASLLQGGPGISGLPIPKDMNKAWQTAQDELREIYAFSDRAERLAEKAEGEAKDQAGVSLFAELIEASSNIDKLTDVYQKAKAMGRSGSIDASLSRLIMAKTLDFKDNLNKNIDSDKELSRDILRKMFISPTDAINDAINESGRRLTTNDAKSLVSMANGIRNGNHFLNHPDIARHISFIEGQLGGNNPTFGLLSDANKNKLKSEAVIEFIDRLNTITGPDGTVVQPILPQLPTLRDRIVKSFEQKAMNIFSSKDDSDTGIGETRVLPISESIPDMITMGILAVKNGASIPRVKNWMARDLRRFFLMEHSGETITDPLAYAKWRIETLSKITGARNIFKELPPPASIPSPRGSQLAPQSQQPGPTNPTAAPAPPPSAATIPNTGF